jgi:hypothetical protein
MESNFDAEKGIDKLSNIVGVKEPINTRILKKKIERGKIETIIHYLALQFGLPVKINLEWESDSELTKPAKVVIPKDLPFFGSPKLSGFPITIEIKLIYRKNPDILPILLAHEIRKNSN